MMQRDVQVVLILSSAIGELLQIRILLSSACFLQSVQLLRQIAGGEIHGLDSNNLVKGLNEGRLGGGGRPTFRLLVKIS